MAHEDGVTVTLGPNLQNFVNALINTTVLRESYE